MKKNYFTTFTLFIILSLVVSSVYAEEPWSKYPDNSDKEFMDANAFYETIDKNLYTEYEGAKVNSREKVSYKDINKILSKFDDYGKARVGGNGYHPTRQVYVFVTVFDAEKHQPIAISGP
ncbi:hypothetical protein [Bacillus sp. JCM 19034]|uniref:hypothetical protein n=1 Tax=Bacillus sp. JCM 19034 TaxID=1481928 RepID=UPI0007814212|nr:hypothetical protein [Bacillus sp. JCM 19034]